jgi:hypothetical protein
VAQGGHKTRPDAGWPGEWRGARWFPSVPSSHPPQVGGYKARPYIGSPMPAKFTIVANSAGTATKTLFFALVLIACPALAERPSTRYPSKEVLNLTAQGLRLQFFSIDENGDTIAWVGKPDAYKRERLLGLVDVKSGEEVFKVLLKNVFEVGDMVIVEQGKGVVFLAQAKKDGPWNFRVADSTGSIHEDPRAWGPNTKAFYSACNNKVFASKDGKNWSLALKAKLWGGIPKDNGFTSTACLPSPSSGSIEGLVSDGIGSFGFGPLKEGTVFHRHIPCGGNRDVLLQREEKPYGHDQIEVITTILLKDNGETRPFVAKGFSGAAANPRLNARGDRIFWSDGYAKVSRLEIKPCEVGTVNLRGKKWPN